MLKTLFSFEWRITRSEYIVTLVLLYLAFVVLVALWFLISWWNEDISDVLIWIQYILFLWSLWATNAKRCHDRGNSWRYQIIPFYGLRMVFWDGERYTNEYGPDPKAKQITSSFFAQQVNQWKVIHGSAVQTTWNTSVNISNHSSPTLSKQWSYFDSIISQKQPVSDITESNAQNQHSSNKLRIFFFDTETASLQAQPGVVLQFWWLYGEYDLHKKDRHEIKKINQYINTNLSIDPGAEKVHGINKSMLKSYDYMDSYITEYVDYISNADIIVAHNLNFDWKMMEAEYGGKLPYVGKKICTMEVSTPILKIASQRWYKRPKLQELHHYLFGRGFDDAHDAYADILATKKCFIELHKRGFISL